ncbi:TlpA disulfide reductase family protein [Robiginitalea sp. M366]|uniref:TlpA disulfide reductase family protein n=1 Tax=Robiginitalea aestuariiviva TaxID=3036903 RepID=UPI00240E5DE2|nr:TlpA disulfide reductase family protein [Robiginitalea aestuariiviva]MDG1572872.1 TlpA disulfide reductase family protein [Robiginitalea aestuariiviva]
MKHPFMLLFALMLIASCNPGGQAGFRIEGQLEGNAADGKQVFLRKSDENLQTVDVDTTTVQGGTFGFEGEIAQPELYYIFVEGSRGAVPMVLEPGTVQVQGHKDSLQLARVSGTPQNEAYADYLEGARELSARRQSMNQELRQAMMQQDSAVIGALRDEYFELQDQMAGYEKTFVETHPDALISVLVINRLLEGESLPIGDLESLYKGLDPSILNSHHASTLRERLNAMGQTAVGSQAPDFSGPTPDGGTLTLSENLGKVTLVDFWAGWCKPCRAENPNVVRVYHKFKDKGFQVIGVSLDRDGDLWRQAIAEDGLDWPQVSHLEYFNDEIALQYNVQAIPASFVLDENGVIVAKNLRGAALEEKIAELLP